MKNALDDLGLELSAEYFMSTWINGSFHPSTWNMYRHHGVTTNNSSEGYNFRLGNKKKICRHPNFFLSVETVIQELKTSSDEASMADCGKSQKPRAKTVKSIAMRKSLMLELQQGKTALISYQQAIGGSLSKTRRATEDLKLEDVEPLNCPRRVTITVPALEEIKVPEAFCPSVPPPPPPSLILQPQRLARRGNLMHLTVLVG